jgi:hypothetical protein
MFVTGDNGCVQLRRRTGLTMTSTVQADDIDETVNRFSFDGAERNLLQGDRIEISTKDPRGLVFLEPSFWEDNRVHHNALLFASVNAMGGIRVYRSFAAALNNDKKDAVRVRHFSGAPLAVTIDVRDMTYHPLGGVTRFTFNTDRAAVDTTSLGDLFAEQYSAGNITGSGTIDCLFEAKRQRCGTTGTIGDTELSLLLPQLILRTELGGQFDAILQLADEGDGKPVFYEVTAITTRTGLTVGTSGVIEVAMDFVTTGEFALRVGEPSGRILKEDYDRIRKEQDLDYLLTEVTD